MLPTQTQPMYFGELFSEIQTNAPPNPSANRAPSATTCDPTLVPQTQADAHLLAQNRPPPPLLRPAQLPEDFSFVQGEDEDDDGDDESEGLRAHPPSQPDPQSQSPPERPAGKRRKQELHRRHSKRYRDNLGELFSELEQLLPQVVPDCKLKTKSQIIATSVNAVKKLKMEVSTLEMRYVMSSPANRAKWVEDTVANATVIQDAIEPFMRLLLGLQSWKHSELWMRMNRSEGGDDSAVDNSFVLRLERVTSATMSHISEAFQDFVKMSQIMTFESGDGSMVGRIATYLSPEWLDLNDAKALAGFKRGELALRCGLMVCFAVPFLIRGHVVAVVLFYDNQPRTDMQQRVSVAQDIASAIGNCYGALTPKKEQSGR